MAARSYKNLKADIKAQLTADFNALIQLSIEELARPTVSPVLTGFFASSWKAGTTRPRARDERENFSPWSAIKTESFSNGYVVLAAGEQPIIEPRYPVPQFKLGQSVFIGNTAKYAADALASPKNQIPNFVQGEMNDLIKSVFNDSNRPRIRVASGRGEGPRGLFGLLGGNQQYVSYEVPGEMP
jgi:hypothetical protein